MIGLATAISSRIATPLDTSRQKSIELTGITEMQDKAKGYTTPARLLHWTVALFVLLLIPAGFVMVQQGLPRTLQNTLFLFHKNFGVIVLVLMLLRVAYRFFVRPPALPDHLPDWQRKIADISHRLLYVALFVMPISGYIRVRAGGFPIEGLDALGIGTLLPRSEMIANVAKTIHYLTAFAIVVLLMMHIGAALQHALLRRDGVFERMWPPTRR
ncbi:cytochrome b [Aliiruegeria lutimaris]